MKVARRLSRAATVLGALLPGLCILPAGCQAPTQPTGPSEMVLHVSDYAAFMDASLSVLRFHQFPPDRVDRARGLIVSEPTTSAQWFELWRADAPGGYQLLESSLATVRRVVTVHIDPIAEPGAAPAPTTAAAIATSEPQAVEERPAGRYRLQVQVDKSRLSAPERQITTASGALEMYSPGVPTTEGLRGPGSRKVQWVPLGRDPLLEAFLLDKLMQASPELTAAE